MSPRPSPSRLIAWLPPVLVVGGMVGAYYLVPGFAESLSVGWHLALDNDTQGLSEWFRDFGAWGPIVIILFMVAQMFLIVFPSWLPMVVAVVGYGPWWGSLISLLGVLGASLLGYWLGRLAGPERLRKWLGESKYDKLKELVDGYGLGGVAVFRMSPFLSTDAISIFAGLVGMPLRGYLLATLAGITPLLAAIAYLGRDIDNLKRGMYWLGGFGMITYLGFILWKRRSAGQAGHASDA